MIVNREYGLAGKFKFDIYTKENKLKYTTDFINNFITSSGLEYIKNYSYADCFRYLSIGAGNAVNSITSLSSKGTTGLESPIEEFSYIGGNLSPFGCQSQSRKNDYVEKGCGYRIDSTGVTLTRSWRVPRLEYDESFNTVATFFTQPYTFKEYMLTPGCTGATGFVSVDDLTPTEACSCSESVYDLKDDSTIWGNESPDFAEQYPAICHSTGAFSRILKDISVNTDEYLVVTYGLSIGLADSTGSKPFSVGVIRNPTPAPPTYNWPSSPNTSGHTALIHPGIKLINNGDVTAVDNINQINGTYQFRLGESFIPPLGIAMEPSCISDKLQVYLSNDNIQFRVNESGGALTDLLAFKPFNPAGRAFPSGLITYHRNYISESSSSESTLGDLNTSLPYFFKPRTSQWAAGLNYAQQSDYTVAVTSDDILDSVQNRDGNFVFKHEIFEPYNPISKTNDPVSMPTRYRTQSVSMQFRAIDQLPDPGIPIRAFVYAYKDDDNWFATIDGLFTPEHGLLAPKTGNSTFYEPPLGFKPDGLLTSSGHYWMDTSNVLQLIYRLKWSADCPPEVEGC